MDRVAWLDMTGRKGLRLARFITTLFAFLIICAAQPARASLADALPLLATDRFADTERAVTTLAASGEPQAEAVLDALPEGRLFFDPSAKTVVVKADDSYRDAATGAAVTPPPGLKKVRVNNAVREALGAARAAMTLLSPDPAKRRAAADAVYASRDAATLPLLDRALAQEKLPDLKTALLAARAAIIATDNAAPEPARIDAIAIIRARGAQDDSGLLSRIAGASEGRVKAAALAGVEAIQSRLALWANAQNVWYGLSLGSVLLLAAIGLSITFGVMGVINMAHGEMVMIGAYATYVVQDYIRAHHPDWFNASLFIAIPLAFVVTGLVGVAIERTIIRFLYGRPLETLLATFGLSLVIQQAVRSLFGPNNREVGAPAFMSGAFDVGGLAITYGRLWIIVFALVVFAALQVVLRATPFGLTMRAVTQNRRMAASMGIDTGRVDALAFGLGSGIAGMAGVALSQIDNVSPNLGQNYIIDSFMVVVFGGVGNLWGTLVAALTLGVANKLVEPWVGAVLGKIAILVFIILFIQKKPRGLFALKGRAVEA